MRVSGTSPSQGSTVMTVASMMASRRSAMERPVSGSTRWVSSTAVALRAARANSRPVARRNWRRRLTPANSSSSMHVRHPEVEHLVEQSEVGDVTWRHDPAPTHPAPEGNGGLVESGGDHAPVQLRDGEAGAGEAGAEQLVVRVDEQPGGEEVRPVSQPLLQCREETDAPGPPTDEEDVAGPKVLGSAIDDACGQTRTSTSRRTSRRMRPWSVVTATAGTSAVQSPASSRRAIPLPGPSPPRSSGSRANSEAKAPKGSGSGTYSAPSTVAILGGSAAMVSGTGGGSVPSRRRHVRPRTSLSPQWSRAARTARTIAAHPWAACLAQR